MKASSRRLFGGGRIALAAIALISVSACGERDASAPKAEAAEGAPRSSVSGGGFTLASASIDLPGDEAMFPDGPHADTVNNVCTACHSASMALTQPPMSADQWRATVTKMREIYKAPVDEKDVPAIVAYLVAMPSQKAAPASAKAQDPDPKVAPDVSGSRG